MSKTRYATPPTTHQERPTARPVATAWRTLGGVAGLYLAAALVVAMPYYLLVVDDPAAETAAERVDLIVEYGASLYAMQFATYVVFGLAVGVLALALWDRLHHRAPVAVQVATFFGLLWAVALVASGMVFTYGMTVVDELAATDATQAVAVWQALEPVALGLGGAGGELLGGLWVLLVSVAVLRVGGLPTPLAWLGVAIGAIGVTSVVPALHDAAIGFGLLEIVWFAWLGIVLLRTRGTAYGPRVRSGA